MINSRLFNFILRTVLFMFLSGALIVITIGFSSYAYYCYLNQFFTPISSSLITASTALLLSILILIVYKSSKIGADFRSKNEINSLTNFIEKYPRVSILAVFLVSFLITGKKTFRYFFEVLLKNFSKEELINAVAKKI